MPRASKLTYVVSRAGLRVFVETLLFFDSSFSAKLYTKMGRNKDTFYDFLQNPCFTQFLLLGNI